MRIFVRKAKATDFNQINYLLIIKDKKSKTSLPYDFYCGLYDGKAYLNMTLYLMNNKSTFHCTPIDYISFSYNFLCRNINQVYIITAKEYNLFAKCKTKEQIHKLIDNIYYEN